MRKSNGRSHKAALEQQCKTFINSVSGGNGLWRQPTISARKKPVPVKVLHWYGIKGGRFQKLNTIPDQIPGVAP